MEINKLKVKVATDIVDTTHPYFSVLDEIVDYTKAIDFERPVMQPKSPLLSPKLCKYLVL